MWKSCLYCILVNGEIQDLSANTETIPRGFSVIETLPHSAVAAAMWANTFCDKKLW